MLNFDFLKFSPSQQITQPKDGKLELLPITMDTKQFISEDNSNVSLQLTSKHGFFSEIHVQQPQSSLAQPLFSEAIPMSKDAEPIDMHINISTTCIKTSLRLVPDSPLDATFPKDIWDLIYQNLSPSSSPNFQRELSFFMECLALEKLPQLEESAKPYPLTDITKCLSKLKDKPVDGLVLMRDKLLSLSTNSIPDSLVETSLNCYSILSHHLSPQQWEAARPFGIQTQLSSSLIRRPNSTKKYLPPLKKNKSG